MARGTFRNMNNTVRQLCRYGIVGVLSNAVGYLLYLLLTATGVGPKLAMTSLYVIGVAQTFVFNKGWSFRYGGNSAGAFRRYVVLYAVGYGLNVMVLGLMVDHLGWPHQWVMLGLMIGMVAFFFAGQKLWVFRPVRGF